MPKPEPKFGETFGFTQFCQGSVSFTRFLPIFYCFLPGFAQFHSFYAPFLPKNASFFCPFLPCFA